MTKRLQYYEKEDQTHVNSLSQLYQTNIMNISYPIHLSRNSQIMFSQQEVEWKVHQICNKFKVTFYKQLTISACDPLHMTKTTLEFFKLSSEKQGEREEEILVA